ncbi:MAG TPA: TIM barrel protein [Isosphaeraceae bacterium]|nr:TIM barrel protein [Isosphaeraceae bacterium]
MRLTRRAMLSACASAGAAPALGDPPSTAAGGRGSLGVVIHSFMVRTAGDRGRRGADRFADPARFLDYARSLGARGVQVGLGIRDNAQADALRDRAEAAAMYLEGIIALPRDDADLARFDAEVRTARRAGVDVVRTVMLSGRRYETFTTATAFRRFAEASSHSLKLAAPVVARHGILLAVENHKDWRADELLAILARDGNDHVGVCLDTGNSIALLEDPMEVVESLAARSFTTHLKDMSLEEYRRGFRLSEVVFGTGILALPRVVQILRAARPGIRFNVEMITRDPLEVPCLTPGYWATFPDLPGRHLARILSLIRDHPPRHPLPRISHLPRDEQLRSEEENVRRCLGYARDGLGL